MPSGAMKNLASARRQQPVNGTTTNIFQDFLVVETMEKTEKKKASVTDFGQETDKQFLERSGVNTQIRDVLTKLIENRPEDPISFLADYFETMGDKIDRVAKAHQQICLTHHSKPAFQNNVRLAYEILGHSRTPERRGKKKDTAKKSQKVTKTVKGFSGSVYTEFLNLLCKEFPPTVRDNLFKKIKCRDYEVVLYDIFKSGVFTCLVLKDFMEQSEHLYQLFDGHSSDKADKLICDTLIQHFRDALTKSSTTDPVAMLEAGYMLGTDKVYSSLGSALYKGASTNHGHMSCDEFVAGLAECFLLKVPGLS